MDNTVKEEIKEVVEKPARKFVFAATYMNNSQNVNPWSPDDVDKMDTQLDVKQFRELVDQCRFFYKKDPLVSSTINKLVEIGINDLQLGKNGLGDNEFKIFTSMKQKLKDFAEMMAMEYLLSGLVIPEVKITSLTKLQVKELGIKKYETLRYPSSLWLRDPALVKIHSTVLTDAPSYFIKIPDEVIYFIMTEGRYKDGNEDKELYAQLAIEYPEFVRDVKSGKLDVKLENDLIFRRKVLTDSPYPIPYLYSVLESLKHKRNLRRMDYSIASRVISAIMLVKLGSDEFPVTEEDSEAFDDIRNQLYQRNTSMVNVERVYQLFANHTLNIEWVYPDTETLLNDAKYLNVNSDIISGLGFPKILSTGETERSNSSDPEFAIIAPEKMMNNFRDKILVVLKKIVYDVATENHLASVPTIKFKPINLNKFKDFASIMISLYETGNISRDSLADIFGYVWKDEMDKKESEQKVLKEKELGEFAPMAFSPNPEVPNNNQDNQQNNPNNQDKNPQMTKKQNKTA